MSFTLFLLSSVFSRSGSFFVFLFLFLFIFFIASSLSSFSPSLLKGVCTFWSLLFPVFRMFFVHVLEELFFETFRDRFNVHIIAISSSFAAAVYVLLALGVQEVSDRWKDGANFLSIEKPSIDVVKGVLGVLFIAILDVDISNDVIAKVIDHDHILDLSVLTHLFEDLFEKGLESSIRTKLTCLEPFRRLLQLLCFQISKQFRLHYCHTCAREGRSRW